MTSAPNAMAEMLAKKTSEAVKLSVSLEADAIGDCHVTGGDKIANWQVAKGGFVIRYAPFREALSTDFHRPLMAGSVSSQQRQ